MARRERSTACIILIFISWANAWSEKIRVYISNVIRKYQKINLQAPCSKSYMDWLWRGPAPPKFPWDQCQFAAFKQELSAVQEFTQQLRGHKILALFRKNLYLFADHMKSNYTSSLCTVAGYLQLSWHQHSVELYLRYLRRACVPSWNYLTQEYYKFYKEYHKE